MTGGSDLTPDRTATESGSTPDPSNAAVDHKSSPASGPGPAPASGSGAFTTPTLDSGKPQNSSDHRQPGAGKYAHAASQVREGQLFEQNREHDRALADFQGHVNSVILGDKYELSFGQGADRIRVRRITAEELVEPFVRTPDLERVVGIIANQPLVVLHGPKGYGKTAALVRTMSSGLREGAGMFYLDPDTDLRSFSCADIPSGSVMILQNLPDGVADRMDAYAVDRIQSELESRECRLGITASRAVNLSTLGPGVVVVEIKTRPSPREVFDRHMAQLLLGTGVSRDDVWAWPDVGRLLDAQLTPDCSLEDAGRLAIMLFRARDDPTAAADRVRAQVTEYADAMVGQWFRRLDSLKAHCMAISLAVLNGLPRETIAREASILEARILPAPDATNVPPLTNPFGSGAAVSPSVLRARVSNETRSTMHGPILVQAMSYLEPGYPGQVLRYIWREHDDGRAALVDWLRYLGKSSDLAVRVRAATAVGVLACEALDFLFDQIIYSWASDDAISVRDSAAIALGPPAADPHVGNTVRSLISSWTKESSTRPLRATAARAYGRSIGLTSPSGALRELNHLADLDDLSLAFAVSSSLCELVVDGTAALSVRVLSEIEQLASERTRHKQVVGRLTLLGLSYLRGVPSALTDRESSMRTWPTLMVLAMKNPRIATLTSRLWALSINDPDIGRLVTDSLDEWAEAAEGIGKLRTTLAELLQGAAADQRSRLAVLRRAQLWAGRNGKAPKTGRHIIECLS
jgi:hypothetical protein